MLGAYRGRLAVTLDRVTNAMVLVGQHGVYCHSQRDPAKPTMDIQIITDELRKAKELIQSVMEDLRNERENRLRANLIRIGGDLVAQAVLLNKKHAPHLMRACL